jgi:hypothetical protein
MGLLEIRLLPTSPGNKEILSQGERLEAFLAIFGFSSLLSQ